MKRTKLYEEYTLSIKNNLLIESILDGEYVNIDKINEASKGDFKPSMKMVKWAIGDGGKSSASKAVKFAIAIADQWDDLDDDSKSKSADKWNSMKGAFKKETQKISDNDKLKHILNDVASAAKKAKTTFDTSIAPAFDGEEATAKDDDKIKAEIKKVEKELEKAENDFTEARKKFDAKEIKWSEVHPLASATVDLEARLINLEGQLDDADEEAQDDVKDVKKLQADFAKAESDFADARKRFDAKEIKWSDVQPFVDKLMSIEAEISGLN